MNAPSIPGFDVRPVQMSDAEAWASYACLPEVKEHTSSTTSSVSDVQAIILRSLAGEESSPIYFALIPAGTTELVATVGFHTISPVNGSAEITYDVAPSYWGQGVAARACKQATEWAFRELAWHRIQATTVLSNVRSQRVLEKCGYEREGLVRNFRVVRGKPTDYWLYSALPGANRGAA